MSPPVFVPGCKHVYFCCKVEHFNMGVNGDWLISGASLKRTLNKLSGASAWPSFYSLWGCRRTMACRSLNQKVAFTSVLRRNWVENLLFEVHRLCQSTLLCTVAAGEDLRSQTRGSFVSFTLRRVKGKATGMMKQRLPNSHCFLRGACMCSRFSLTLSAGGNYN